MVDHNLILLLSIGQFLPSEQRGKLAYRIPIYIFERRNMHDLCIQTMGYDILRTLILLSAEYDPADINSSHPENFG